MREDSRSRSLAEGVGGEARTFFDLRIHAKPLVPLRYLVSAVRTLAYLIRRRPRAVIAQAPPVPAAAIAYAWARMARVPIVLDTHPASFGTERARADRIMRPLLAWLAPRAAGCIVTTPRLAAQIEAWGGRPLIVHEAPMAWSQSMATRPCSTEKRVLFVCTFAPDEPVMETLRAAAELPDAAFLVTGDRRRITPAIERAAPPNVQFVGYLGPDDYVAALRDADLVLSLTLRSESVARSAHEAVDALRPLVMSEWEHLRELFPFAVFVANDGCAIAAGVVEAFRRWPELSAAAPEARAHQHERWSRQLEALSSALGVRAAA